ncbi:MAG: hypothetical protein ACXAEU_11515 [Candidatus Hodarchaeales archaeon]|jgi:hypothetical protein
MPATDNRENELPAYKKGMNFREWTDKWTIIERAAILPFKINFSVSDCLYLNESGKKVLFTSGHAWNKLLIVFVKPPSLDENQFLKRMKSYISSSPSQFRPDDSSFDNEPRMITRVGFIWEGATGEDTAKSFLQPEILAASTSSVLLLKIFSRLILNAGFDSVTEMTSDDNANGYRVSFWLPCSLLSDNLHFIYLEPWFDSSKCYTIAVAKNYSLGEDLPVLQVNVHVKGVKTPRIDFIKAVLFELESINLANVLVTNYPDNDELVDLLSKRAGRRGKGKQRIWGYKLLESKRDFPFFTKSFDPGKCYQVSSWWHDLTGSDPAISKQANGQLILHSLACLVKFIFAYFYEEGFWKKSFGQLFDKFHDWDESITLDRIMADKGTSGVNVGSDLDWYQLLFPPRYTLFEDLFQLFPDAGFGHSLSIKRKVLERFPPAPPPEVVRFSEVTEDDFFEPL